MPNKETHHAKTPSETKDAKEDILDKLREWRDGEYGILRSKHLLDEAITEIERLRVDTRRCVCQLVEPCSPACSCVTRGSSHGCTRCARYGSAAQRRAAALRLAGLIDGRHDRGYPRG